MFDKLTKGLKDLFPKKGSGLGLLGGGIALLLGGLAALVTGLMTDGPFKGLLKILSKIGLTGGIKLIQAGAKLFIENLKLVFKLIGNSLKNAAKFIGRLFGKDVYKTLLQIGKSVSTKFTSILSSLTSSITNVFSKVKGFFTSIFANIFTFVKGIGSNIFKSITGIFGKVAGKSVIGKALGGVGKLFATIGSKLFKFLKPVLTKIPGIGTIISWGFAFTRFKSGDIIGGIIDVLSGIASLFPGIGTAIAFGLDILNAFLDFKSGGADAKASKKKGNILWEWAKGLGSLIWKGIKYIPVIGPLIETAECLFKGKWFDALWNFARINPLFDPVVALIEYFTGSNIKETLRKGNLREIGSKILEWGKGIVKMIWSGIKYIPVIGPLLAMIENLFKGEWFDALWNFARINPLFDPLVGLVEYFTGTNIKETLRKGNLKEIAGKMLEFGKGIVKMIWSGIKYIPVIGPLLAMVENIFKGEWKEALWNFARINPLFDPLVAVIEYFTGGDLKKDPIGTLKTAGKKVLEFTKGVAKWIYDVAKKLPVIGRLIKTGEFLLNGQWGNALNTIARIIPGMGWILDLFGFTEQEIEIDQKQENPIKKLWTWMKDTLFEKVTGFVGNLIGGVKDWWSNLSWDPSSWFGAPPSSDISKTVQPSSTTPIQQQKDLPGMKDGGVIPQGYPDDTYPALLSSGETVLPKPEAISLEKYFNKTDLSLNNDTLENIADNTKDTNASLAELTRTLIKFVTIIDKKLTTQRSSTIINAGGRQEEPASASVAANRNSDPIRAVRAQFA